MLHSAPVMLLLWGALQVAIGTLALDTQIVFVPTPGASSPHLEHIVDEAILSALKAHHDPVAAFVSLLPDVAGKLAEPRLLHLVGEREPEWMSEGNKLRLRKSGRKFMDITDHRDFYAQYAEASSVPKANLPKLKHQGVIKHLFAHILTERMDGVLKHLTSYYNRYYDGVIGEQSAAWLHDQIAKIIDESPFHTHISLEYFTHSFLQPSIIARFEPKVRNFSLPLTILGAHQDSINYLFPLLPAPGADDDCSGTVTILEAFRVLAHSGYTPKHGPVEFHWYAAEEGGLLGSQAIARYKKEQGTRIGAMLDFDMTAFVARNATETLGLIKTEAHEALTDWLVKLSQEYISIPAKVYDVGPYAGSDYMPYTKLNYPSAIASEGDPKGETSFPGELNPYIHGVNDTMDINDDTGTFSIDHMARFSELAIAFAVEQAGWDVPWQGEIFTD